MNDQNKNLILATVLSAIVFLVWMVLFPPPDPQTAAENDLETSVPGQVPGQTATQRVDGGAVVPDAAPSSGISAPAGENTQAVAQNSAARVEIETARLKGSISLRGGRIDDLWLKDYRVSLDEGSDIVRMLTPVGQAGAYYALYGWAPGAGLLPEQVPGPDTIWSLSGSAQTLTPTTPISLIWDNGSGLVFERQIAIDEDYMFTVTQTVSNNSAETVALAPYSVLARHGLPSDQTNIWVVHEGAVQFAGDDQYSETNWDDFPSFAERDRESGLQARWAGFSDHYWQTVLIAPDGFDTRVETFRDEARDIYQTTAQQATKTVAAGDVATITSQVFAGAKEWDVIRRYENTPGFWASLLGAEPDPNRPQIDRFIDSIDWGWFFMLTKPIFWLLHELNLMIGNMGWAIIALTFLIKLALFPLARKSYISMARMKELQPEMEALKERAGEDREKLQKGMMELYKKNKVNPAAGCLPILLQIPIFFSLYKVIFVTIELRHAPWFGPFQDLSAPDPTSLMNLFGALPFAAPEAGTWLAVVFIGILPILMGISMWFQQKLNPAPPDPTQQMIFAWMPWVFMFMLAPFASGLIVYWIANNVLTFAQQYTIMRSQGYTPDIMGNIKSGFKKTPKDKAPKDKAATKSQKDG